MPVAAIAGPVLGAVAGGLISNRGSSQSQGTPATVTQTQANEPWGGIQPYLAGARGLYPEASARYQSGPWYPGPFIGPQSQYTQQGVERLATDANDPNSLTNTASRTLGGALRGDYLNVDSNPYLRGAVEQALGLAGAGVSSRFGGENYGGSANQEWLARILSNTALPTYANAYQAERQNQLNAVPLAQGLQMAGASPYLLAGATQDTRTAAEIAAGKEQFYSPWDVLGRYASILGQIPTPTSGSGTSTSTTPTYTNPWANAIGGAIGGAQIGANVGNYFNQPQSYGSFMDNAWANGFGPAFTQPGIYG